MAKLPDDWADVKKTIPPRPPANAKAPKVFYSNTAAELIAFDGEPQWKKIQGTNLGYVTNTDSDFFIDYSDQPFLLSHVRPVVHRPSANGALVICQRQTPLRLCQHTHR